MPASHPQVARGDVAKGRQQSTLTMHRYMTEAEETDLIMSTSPGQVILMLRTELSC